MRGRRPISVASAAGGLLGLVLVVLLVLPLVALAGSSSFADVVAGMQHPTFWPAVALSGRTTLVSLALTMITGTPLAWWLATSRHRSARVVEVVVDLPIVVPPAVVGVALLQTFGRRGMLGPLLGAVGVEVPFTEVAVILAQVVVASPFYVQAAANAFRKVDPDTLIVARTLGASGPAAFVRVAVPIALPGLLAGASLAWARALGEFGATLLFAGNRVGRTQTMPLATYSALEADVRLAVVFALVLTAMAAALLAALRLIPTAWSRRRGGVS